MINCLTWNGQQIGWEDENQRNTNEHSQLFRLIGTQPLVINSIGPNSTTIRDSTNAIKVNLEVETSAGYQEGASICEFSSANENRFIEFEKTGKLLN